jgi:hypothetical protein
MVRACYQVLSGFFLGHSISGDNRMLPVHNIARCIATTRLHLGTRVSAALFVLALLLCPATVTAQPGGAKAAPPLPDPAQAVAAHALLLQWVQSFNLPDPDRADAAIPVDGCEAVCVRLRRQGRVMGTGIDGSAEAPLRIRRAAGRALGEVLGDPLLEGLPDSLRNRIAEQLVVELELAGRMQPLLGRQASDLADQIEPGRDGLAVRRFDVWHYVFPGQMLAANLARNPLAHLPSMVREVGLDPANLDEHIATGAVTVYRFRTVHLAQDAPGGTAFQLVRGDRLVPTTGVETQLDEAAWSLVQHIGRRIYADPDHPRAVGLLGEYRPVRDMFDPAVAPPSEQALTAMALAWYAATDRVDAQRRATAVELVQRLMRDLHEVEEGEFDPWGQWIACACIVHARLALPENQRTEAGRVLFDGALRRLMRIQRGDTGMLHADPQTGELVSLSINEQAAVASALARGLRDAASDITARQVRQLLDAAWASAPEPNAIALLPWMLWAEQDYAQAVNEPMRHVERFARMQQQLHQLQFGMTDGLAGDPEMQGGFLLNRATTGERANAQSTRIAAALAGMLRDPRITAPEQHEAARTHVLAAMRFLLQLTVREGILFQFRNAERARGGLRAAPWISDMPAAAQAVGLLAWCESLRSLAPTPAAPAGRDS